MASSDAEQELSILRMQIGTRPLERGLARSILMFERQG